jgi:hypothetical protein
MDQVSAITSLAVALWAAYTASNNGFKYLNEIRDNILCGSDGKRSFTQEHRKIMLYCDWLPMMLVLSGMLAAFVVIIWSVPEFVGPNQKTLPLLKILCLSTSLVPLFVSVGNFVWGLIEFRRMTRAISLPPPPAINSAIV